MSGWVEHCGQTRPVPGDTTVAIRLADDTTLAVELGKASEFYWGGGEGRIGAYCVVDTSVGVGDVKSKERGAGARYNTGKPAMELIPLALIAEVESYGETHGLLGGPQIARAALNCALSRIGDFQMRDEGRDALLHAAAILTADGQGWQECARVFGYGRAKYAAWNWAKGMAWSIPIGCAARHLLGAIGGEANDVESGLSHRGHTLCNIVMLLWFMSEYPEGDDRYTPPLPHAPAASLEGNGA